MQRQPRVSKSTQRINQLNEDLTIILGVLGLQVFLWVLDPTLWTVNAYGILAITIFTMGYERLEIKYMIVTIYITSSIVTLVAYILLPIKFGIGLGISFIRLFL